MPAGGERRIDRNMQRRTCHFSGRVQGVGFRYTVEQIAKGYPVVGYVRNLADGRVELVMEGEADVMAKLVREVQQRMEGFIGEMRCEQSPGNGEFNMFAIRY